MQAINEQVNLSDYFSRIEKEETGKPLSMRYLFDGGRFICKVKKERVDSRFMCYIMKVQTNYGYLLDRSSRLIDEKAEDPEYIVKKFFVSSILGIA